MPACRYEPNIFLSQCGKAQHTLWRGIRSFPSQIWSRHLSPSSRYAEAPSKLILWGLYQRKNHCKTTSKNRILTMPCIERSVPFIQRSFWSQFGGFCLYLHIQFIKIFQVNSSTRSVYFTGRFPFALFRATRERSEDVVSSEGSLEEQAPVSVTTTPSPDRVESAQRILSLSAQVSRDNTSPSGA